MGNINSKWTKGILNLYIWNVFKYVSSDHYALTSYFLRLFPLSVLFPLHSPFISITRLYSPSLPYYPHLMSLISGCWLSKDITPWDIIWNFKQSHIFKHKGTLWSPNPTWISQAISHDVSFLVLILAPFSVHLQARVLYELLHNTCLYISNVHTLSRELLLSNIINKRIYILSSVLICL